MPKAVVASYIQSTMKKKAVTGGNGTNGNGYVKFKSAKGNSLMKERGNSHFQ